MNISWGDNNDDIAVDKATPLLIKALSLCEEVMEIDGEIEDVELSVGLNLIEVQNGIMDAIVSVRKYQKDREKETKESEKR